MPEKDLTIQDLNRLELKHVFEVFAQGVGISHILAKHRENKDILTPDEFIHAFRNVEFPGKYASSIEMAWTSEPINGCEFKRLKGYSVFWKMGEQAWQVWIGRTPASPQNSEYAMYITDIVNELYRSYGLYESEDSRNTHSVQLLKWQIKWKVIRASIYAISIMFALYTIIQSNHKTNTDIYNAVSMIVIVFFISQYISGKLGFMLSMALFITVTILYLFVLQRMYSLNLIHEQWMIFGVSLVVGLYFSDRKYPDTIAIIWI